MRHLAVLAALLIVASSCGGDDAPPSIAADSSTTTTTVAPTTSATPSATTARPAEMAIGRCADVEIPAPDELGTLGGEANVDSAVIDATNAYTDQFPETFAGGLVDRDHGGVWVLRLTDDPAPHEAAIEALPVVAESGVVVDVVQVDFSSAELEALQAAAAQRFLGNDQVPLVGLGSGNRYNRVTLSLVRPSATHLDRIAEAFPDRAAMFCLEGELWDESMAGPSVDEPFTVMADAGDDPMVTCGGHPFRHSLLATPPDVDPESTDPAEAAALGHGRPGPAPADGWYTLARDAESATFARFGDVWSEVRVELAPAGWVVRGSSAGQCRLRLAVPDGVGLMQVELDPDNPPDPAASTLHLLVAQRSCSGGASGVENMRPPEVIETVDSIRIAIAVVPPEGPQTCPGNEPDPIAIDLDGPVGDREILDGLTVPPEPLDASVDF